MNILFSMGRKYRRVQVPFETSESHLGASTAGRMRLSKIKAAKQLDFLKSVSDKTILIPPAHGCSKNQGKKPN